MIPTAPKPERKVSKTQSSPSPLISGRSLVSMAVGALRKKAKRGSGLPDPDRVSSG